MLQVLKVIKGAINFGSGIIWPSGLYCKLVGTEWTVSQEYPGCLPMLLLGSSPDMTPEGWLPQSRVVTYLQLVGKQGLLIWRPADPEEQCREPELLNHATVWACATHWRSAWWLTTLRADGSINNQDCDCCWELKIWHSKSLQITHKYSCLWSASYVPLSTSWSLFTYINLNSHNTTLNQHCSKHLKMWIYTIFKTTLYGNHSV